MHGALPYRDFVLVQPPGITLLMTPAALVARAMGTAWGMAAGRILTTLASVAAVPLAGLLVRHRGTFATVAACGVLAVYPDSVAAAHTVLVEPWLVLFCLAGALLVFRGDQLSSGRRLAAGGVMFGFAGAVESWAIIPVLVICALCLRWPRRAGSFAGGVALGFAVPVLPFAALSPGRFFQSLIVAQVGPRAAVNRVPAWNRLKEMTGLSDTHLRGRVSILFTRIHLQDQTLIVATLVVLGLLAVGGLVAVTVATRRPPTALECFALATAALVIGVFLWPSQFHYHFSAFLAPFLGLAVALPAARLLALGAGGGWPHRAAVGVAALAVVVFAILQGRAEAVLAPLVTPATLTAAERVIPPGSCVATDEVSLLILANRFVSGVPGCSLVVDGLGTDLALSGGRKPSTGASRVPTVAAVWRQAFTRAQFVWLSPNNTRRIAWSQALNGYLASHFTRVLTDRRGDALYQRQRSGG